MFIVTTRADIETWVANYRYDITLAGYQEQVVESLRAADHPPWGTDWEPWIGEETNDIVDRILMDEP